MALWAWLGGGNLEISAIENLCSTLRLQENLDSLKGGSGVGGG